MTEPHHRLKWPTRPEVATYLGHAVLVLLVFTLVYGGTNWLASLRPHPLALYFSWELRIPLTPWMIYPYLSLNLLMAWPLFVLERAEIRPLAWAMLSATAVAGLFHLLLPAELGFTRQETVPGYEWIFRQVHRWLLPHNLVPSLHITYSALVVLAVIHGAGMRLRAAFLVWLAVICVSVVAVHQHHVMDVITGLALGWICFRWVFLAARPHRPLRNL